MNIDEIIQNHLAAVGGKRAVESLHSIRVAFHVV
jgi:hypothetical protein